MYAWRNTPTCVGKTIFTGNKVLIRQKHPHVRGEDLARSHAALQNGGNTPTCVGKTSLAAEGPTGDEKHPHVRGEDFFFYKIRK